MYTHMYVVLAGWGRYYEYSRIVLHIHMYEYYYSGLQLL